MSNQYETAYARAAAATASTPRILNSQDIAERVASLTKLSIQAEAEYLTAKYNLQMAQETHDASKLQFNDIRHAFSEASQELLQFLTAKGE